MPRGRLVAGSIVAMLLALLAVTVDAQLPKIHMPKAPAVPGVKTASPAPAEAATSKKSFGCADISDDVVNRLLKAWEVARKDYEAAQKAFDSEMAKAKAKRAEADAIQSKRAQGTVSAMMQNADCKDAFKEKDPRAKEIARLEDQVAAADSAGDEKKSEALHKKLDPLNDALEYEADRACGGKGSSALMDCLATKKVALAKQGITEPMLTVQAQGECMSNPATSGAAGMTAESDEEKKLKADADDIEKKARENLEQAQANKGSTMSKESGMSEHDRAIFVECCIGVRRNDAAWLAQTPPAARAALQNPDVQKKLCE